jgi:hypothetical protein
MGLRLNVKSLRAKFFAEVEVQIYDALNPKRLWTFLVGIGGGGRLLSMITIFQHRYQDTSWG